LHPKPDQVTDELFHDNPFFDPRDGLQVKCEMLRRVRVDGHAVSRAAASCGFSRPTYYQARDAFERDGLVGLLPEKKGPKRAHKLTPEVLDFIEAQLEAQPGLTPSELVSRVGDKYDIEVHHKSIARARARSKKKPPSPRRT
jgi:transposase